MVSGGFGKAFLLGAVLFALALAAPAPSLAEPASVGLVVDTSGGYARLIFAMPELSEEVEASAQIAGNVLIVNFTKPVRIAIESIAMQAPGYFSAARRDPDSKAIRFALARKVKLNSMAAAEKFFIDLLPDTWSGAPPALPQEVIEELARRARAPNASNDLRASRPSRRSCHRFACASRTSPLSCATCLMCRSTLRSRPTAPTTG
jgi:hypothetical protein